MGVNQSINGFSQILHRRRFEIKSLQNLITTHVDDFSLFIHYFVVLQNIFTNLAVALLNRALSTLDCFRNHLCFNRFIIWQRTTHHPRQSPRCK